ncbi:MAG: GNAT family protein [Sphingomonas sp.]
MTGRMEDLSVRLGDEVVHLEPLDETHREALRAACAQDEAIWEIYPASFAGAHFDASFDAYAGDGGRRLFALFAGGVLIGMSGYLNIDARNGVLEIGGTYLAPPARGTDLNRRFKRLLIDHAIACGFVRIEFRIDTRNARSMRAVAKLGALHEGTLRQQRVTWTGYRRDTAVFGLLAAEWDAGANLR